MEPFSSPSDAIPVTNDCAAVRAQLYAFIDGELTRIGDHVGASASLHQTDGDADAAVIGAHLATCAQCTRVARQMRAQRARLLALGERETIAVETRASDALRERVARLLAG